MSNRKMRRAAALCACVWLLLLCALLLCGCSAEGNYRSDTLFTVHYLDVGQSDCAFIEICGEYTMMIDTADPEHADDACSYVRALGYDSIDVLVLTHPHSDHIGGAARVLGDFSVGCVYMTSEKGYGEEYDALMRVIGEQDITVKRAVRGISFDIGEARCEFLSPTERLYEDENDNSAVLRITYGERRFLFLGDCEAEAERGMLTLGAQLSSDVVKVGHHGSNSSSSEEFISALGAKYAVISCSKDNDYGHPSPYVRQRWRDAGADVFITAKSADIIAATDGESLFVGARSDAAFWRGVRYGEDSLTDTEKAQDTAQRRWVLDSDTHTVHRYGCYLIGRIDPDDTEYSDGELKYIKAEGYETCTSCISGQK